MSNCEICFEPFDHSIHKPYSLMSCPHTYCLSCLQRLTSNTCPQCAIPIIGKNLNIALLKFIPESSYDKLKSESLKVCIDLNEINQNLKNDSQIKLTKHEVRLTSIKQIIADETNKMISLLRQNEQNLTNECDTMLIEIKSNLNGNKYQDEIQISSLKEKIEKDGYNQDELINLNNTLLEIKLKSNELSVQIKNYENYYEFIQNKILNDNLSIGKIETLNGYLKKGHELHESNKFEEAIQFYDKAITLNPTCLQAFNNKGGTLCCLLKYEEAIQCYNKGIEFYPNYSSIYCNKGCALVNSKKYQEAIQCFEKAIQLDPNDLKAIKYKEKAMILYAKK